MKTNEKQLKLLLLAAVVVILFLAYRFGYQPYTEKTSALQTEIKDYQSKISILNGKILRRATFDEGIATSSDKCFEVLNKYGGGNTNEKTIMFVHALEQEANMQISSITFGTDSNLYYTDKLASTTGMGIYLYKQTITVSYRTDYNGFKAAMDFINQYPERMNVDSVTIAYETLSGMLTGTMSINLYSVIGGQNEYVAPATGVTDFGQSSIFGITDSVAYPTPAVNPAN